METNITLLHNINVAIVVVAIGLALPVNFFSRGSINKLKCSIFILNKFDGL